MICVPSGFFVPGVGGGGFDPLSLSPALWLDFSDSTKLFDATSGGSTPANDVGIARVEDKSGSGRNFTQGSPDFCPTRQTSVQNGLDAARFDGSNDFMAMVAGLDIHNNVSGASWIGCWKYNTNPTIQRVVGSTHTNSFGSGRTIIGAGVTSRKSRASVRRLDGVGAVTQAGTTDIGTSPIVQSMVMDYVGQTLKQYFNNNLEATSTGVLTSGNTSATNSASVNIGAFTVGIGHADIDLYEIFCFSRAISDDDRTAIHDYLASKWAI